MAMTPFAAAFVVGSPRERTQPDWIAWGIGCGVLAWVGVGLQCVVLPYLVPLVRILVPVLIFHQTLPASLLGGGLRRLLTRGYSHQIQG